MNILARMCIRKATGELPSIPKEGPGARHFFQERSKECAKGSAVLASLRNSVYCLFFVWLYSVGQSSLGITIMELGRFDQRSRIHSVNS